MSAVSIIPTILAVCGVTSSRNRVRGVLLATLAPELRTVADRLLQSHAGRTETRVLPAAVLHEEFTRQRVGAQQELGSLQLPPVEAARVATVISFEKTPFSFEATTTARFAEALSSAATVDEVSKVTASFMDTVEREHATVFAGEVAVACRKACLRVGFNRLQTEVRTDQVRVIATDGQGRSLVSEIGVGLNSEPRIETEVIGVKDGSCAALLDAFDEALEREGVVGARRDRRLTGGVPAVVRKVLGAAVSGSTSPGKSAAAESRTAAKRAARLNGAQSARSRGR
jgi:hypothetical protein